MLLLEKNIPYFLLSSLYLQSLLSNGPFPEEGLEIPDGSGKQDLTVNSKADLMELLQTLRFWLVPEVAEQSSDLLGFAFLPKSKTDFIEVATEFRKDIPLVDELLHIISGSVEKRLDVAAGFGRLPVLKMLHLGGLGFDFGSTGTIQAAARGGHFECAKYIVDSSPATFKNRWIESACRVAAEHGHLACVKQMLAEWGTTSSTAAVIGASAGNHLEILTYATAIGHDQDSVLNAMSVCTQRGNLECLKHLHSLGFDRDVYLSKGGQLNCLQFLWEHNYLSIEDICNNAAKNGHLECVKFSHEQGVNWNENTCALAAEGGHLECLQYMREQGCPWWDRAAVADLPVNDRNVHCTNRIKVALDFEYSDGEEELIAASACHAPTIDCLLYVLEQGAALSPFCASNVVDSGSLATLQFLHARGFTWEARDCEVAAWSESSLECVGFLHEIGTPWDANTLTAAAVLGRLDCLQYAHERGAPWAAEASLACKLDIMKFVHEHGCPWHKDTCLTAVRLSSLECLQYAHEHGAPWTSEVFRQATTIECYEYAVAHGCPGAELNEEFFNRAK